MQPAEGGPRGLGRELDCKSACRYVRAKMSWEALGQWKRPSARDPSHYRLRTIKSKRKKTVFCLSRPNSTPVHGWIPLPTPCTIPGLPSLSHPGEANVRWHLPPRVVPRKTPTGGGLSKITQHRRHLTGTTTTTKRRPWAHDPSMPRRDNEASSRPRCFLIVSCSTS